MPYSMMLDSGHGGSDPGAVYRGRREKDDTLRLTLAVGEILQENGIEVLYTRTTDVYLSPYERAVEANQAGVDFFLSIHRNSYPTDNEVMGVESLIYDLSGLKYQGESKTESCSVEADTDASCTCRGWIYQFRYG